MDGDHATTFLDSRACDQKLQETEFRKIRLGILFRSCIRLGREHEGQLLLSKVLELVRKA